MSWQVNRISVRLAINALTRSIAARGRLNDAPSFNHLLGALGRRIFAGVVLRFGYVQMHDLLTTGRRYAR